MSDVFVSTLSPRNMGELAYTLEWPGEDLLRELVTDPVKMVCALSRDDQWPEHEAAIVAELAVASDKHERDEIKKRIPALVPARFKAYIRNNAECIGRQVVGHDFDGVVADTFERACEVVRARLPGRFLVIHTTATERNREDTPKRPLGSWCLRVYELLDRPAGPEEWETRVKPHMRSLGGQDDGALDISRLLYMPVRTAGYRRHVYEGPRTPLESLPIMDVVPAATSTAPRTPAATRVNGTRQAAVTPVPVIPGSPEEATRIPEAVAMLRQAANEVAEKFNGDASNSVAKSSGLWCVAQQLVRSIELSIETSYALIREHYNPACKPPWSEREIRHKLESARDTGGFTTRTQEEQISARVRAAVNAMAPRPLPAFPVDEIPAVLRSFVMAQATFMEVPIDLPAMFALGACSAAIAGRVDLEVRAGYVEPLNLFVVVGARTGERKSPIHAACFGPLMEVERIKAETAAPLVATIKARRDALQKSLLRKQSEYANLKREDVPLERANYSAKPGGVMLEREIAELAVQIEQLKIPPTPKLLVSDVTVEKLASLLGEQNGRLCVSSDEGTILSIIAGRYAKDGRSSFDVLLQGYSGTAVRVDRQSTDRPPVYVRRPRLTICLAVQPEVIERLSKDETMRSQGLLARFLYALPESMVGRRPVAGAAMPDDVRRNYDAVVKTMASWPTPEEQGLDEIPRIRLSPGAYELHRQLQRDLEPRLDPKTGDLAEIVDWASKYAGNVARIAGVLHCVKLAQGTETGAEVSEETMRQAIRIGEYLLSHALAAYGSMGKSNVEKDAEVILGWAQKRGQTFAMRELRRLAPREVRGDKKRLEAALEYLVDGGQLRAEGDGWAAA